MPDYRQGWIEVIAGTGLAGGEGDGGPAREAELFMPVALCLDELGNLFIADHNTFSIRRVDGNSGLITTVAGGMAEPDGPEEFDPCEQILPDGQPAVWAAIEASDLAMHRGRLYMALPDEQRIRYVDLVSGRIFTTAGSGEAGFGGDGGSALRARFREPSGLCFDRAGNLYVADTENGRVRRVEAGSGLVSSLAGGGRINICHAERPVDARQAELLRPRRLLALPGDELIVGCETGLFRLDVPSGRIAPLVKDATDCDALTLGVDAIACDAAGNLFFSSSVSQAIWMLALGAERLTRVVGSGWLGCEGRPTAQAASLDLACPRGLAVAPSGELYFTDTGLCQAFRVRFS